MQHKNQEGFTLIELILTTVVLATTMLAIFGLFITLSQINARANSLTIATQVAQRELELYRNLHYNAVNVGTEDHTASAGLAGYTALGSPKSVIAVVTLTDPNGLKTVDITVNYADRGIAKKVRVTTYVALNGINK